MDLKKFLPPHLGGCERNVYYALIYKFTDARNRKPLWDFVKETKPERILEIGLGNGYNAEKMMKFAGDCEYYCFDGLYIRVSREAYENMKDKENVSFFVGDSKKTLLEHVRNLPKMDLIFIDGGHDYETVKNDWDNSRKLMHENTAVWFHDYDLHNGVQKVVDEISDEYYKKIIKPEFGPSLAVISSNKELIKKLRSLK